MNKQPLTEDTVLQVATDLITANGSTTTVDVKRELRKKDYEAFQSQVSKIMMDLYGAGKLASTNDPGRDYQIYDLPKNGAAAVTNDDILTALKNSKNAAVVWIIGNLHLLPLTRKAVVQAGHAGSTVDTALQTLLKKGIIVRTGTGEYSATAVTPAQQSTPVVDPVTKEQKLQELATMLGDGIKQLEAVHANIVKGLSDINN